VRQLFREKTGSIFLIFRWNPPLFGLDNIQMWPIFPHQYANPDEQSIGGLRVSGFTVGIIAMVKFIG